MAVTEKQLQNLRPMQPGDPSRSKGRPKGALSAKTVINKWLSKKTKGKAGLAKGLNLTQLDQITLAQLAKALKGDTQAFNALLDRTEGKPEQRQINEFADGTEISVTIGQPTPPNA